MLGKTPVGRGRNIIPHHQILGKTFAPFDLRRRLVRPENFQTCGLKGINNPHGQRYFRTNNRQINFFRLSECTEGIDLLGTDLDTLGQLGDTGVPRSTVDLLNQ